MTSVCKPTAAPKANLKESRTWTPPHSRDAAVRAQTTTDPRGTCLCPLCQTSFEYPRPIIVKETNMCGFFHPRRT